MKNAKKQLLSLLLAAVMLLSVTACSKPEVLPQIPDNQTERSAIGGTRVNTSRAADDYSEIFQAVKSLTQINEVSYDRGADMQFFSNSEDEVADFVVEKNSNFPVIADNEANAPGAADANSRFAPMGGGEGGSEDFSGTNNQVEGVEESDIVKTDGKYIFIAGNNNYSYVYGNYGMVSVVKPDNGNMELVTQIKQKYAYPGEMFIYEQKLIIIWNKNQEKQETIVEVYDISLNEPDFSAPSYSYSQDGHFNSARMVENNMYLITTFTPSLPREFDEEDIDCYVPSYRENGKRAFVPANCIVLPEKTQTVYYTVIGGLDVNNPEMSVSVCSNIGMYGIIYVSPENIYVTYTSYEQLNGNTDYTGWWRDWGWVSETYTIIDKFSFKAGTVEFVASGKVKGNALNQFSFDEHNGVLRVVTDVTGFSATATDMPEEPPEEPKPPEQPDFGDDRKLADEWYKNVHQKWYEEVYYKWYEENQTVIDKYHKWFSHNWGNQGASLYTLDGELNLLGEVNSIAKGESVQSVRFMGDKGYIVTFLRTDPLFSFDLSDPANPVITDELKIPGYSSYMHPWTDGMLLGMGVSADDNGVRDGLKLSMFDVADSFDLSERHVYIIDYNERISFSRWINSAVEYDHRAALVSSERNIIGFPYSYSVSGETPDGGWSDRRGTVYAVFSYGNEGFTLMGEIEYALNPDEWWEFNRGLYIGEYIYAIGNNVIASAKIGDGLEDRRELRLVDN